MGRRFALVTPAGDHGAPNDQQCASFQEFVALKDVAIDLTLEDWEELESALDQRDLFWDVALNGHQDIFSFSKCHPDPGVLVVTALLRAVSPTGCWPGTGYLLWSLPGFLRTPSLPCLSIEFVLQQVVQDPVVSSPTQLSPITTHCSC